MVYTTSRNSDIIAYENEKMDHRKRRRNRIRASCLNCYASKRKCDKKRPCTRCVRLGNTAFCVYETDDPYIHDYAHLDEIKQLRHRIVELEGIVKRTKQPHPKGFLPNENRPSGFVHFRPNLLYAGDTRVLNTQGPVHDISLKQEKVFYHSHPVPSDTKEFDDFSERRPDSEGNNNYFLPDYSHDSASSSRTSYSDRSPYSPPHHDMGTSFSSNSSSAITLRNVTGHEGGTLLKSGCAYDPFHARPLSFGHHANSIIYQPSSITESHCHCLQDPQSLAPLVNLGFALRTSLEVLEKVHSHGSYCGLFSYISFLENHIFSLRSPQERPENSHTDLDFQKFSPVPSSYTSTSTDP